MNVERRNVLSTSKHWQRARKLTSNVPACVYLTGLLGTGTAKSRHGWLEAGLARSFALERKLDHGKPSWMLHCTAQVYFWFHQWQGCLVVRTFWFLDIKRKISMAVSGDWTGWNRLELPFFLPGNTAIIFLMVDYMFIFRMFVFKHMKW